MCDIDPKNKKLIENVPNKLAQSKWEANRLQLLQDLVEIRTEMIGLFPELLPMEISDAIFGCIAGLTIADLKVTLRSRVQDALTKTMKSKENQKANETQSDPTTTNSEIDNH